MAASKRSHADSTELERRRRTRLAVGLISTVNRAAAVSGKDEMSSAVPVAAPYDGGTGLSGNKKAIHTNESCSMQRPL
jgi:hypothetical protein